MPIDNRVGASESTASDVYSFGVFLMELLTGQEDLDIGSLGSNESLFQRVRASTISIWKKKLFSDSSFNAW